MATRSRVTIREIQDERDPAFRAAYRLLRREFADAEMSPLRDWTNALRESRQGLWTDVAWHLLVAMRGSTVLAAASGSYLGNVHVGVIGYVAVRPDARSLGLGPRIRRALRRRFERDAERIDGSSLDAIVGEVKTKNPWLRTLVRREGAIALDFEYVQPALGHHLKPVPLTFYYEPLDRPRQSLDAAYLRRLLYTLWRRAYRVPRPLSRPEFRRMMRSLDGRRRIGQRELPTRTR
jgi:GNAT superfamily N-acetyltransferase